MVDNWKTIGTIAERMSRGIERLRKRANKVNEITEIKPVTIPTAWAVERRLADGQVLRLGTLRWVGDGYTFNPNVAGRKPSRKVHDSMAAALPRWVGYPNRCETRVL